MNLRTFVIFQAVLAFGLLAGCCATCIHTVPGPHDTPVIDGTSAPDAGR